MRKLIIISFAAIIAGSCSNSAPMHDDIPEGWTLVWEENFDSAYLDTTIWSRIDRGTADWNNYMSKSDTCYDLSDGNLILRGIATYDGCGDSVPYLTGGIFSKGKKAFCDGRLDIRARILGSKGSWPAIWLLPDPEFSDSSKNCAWPYGGEIDIMERLSHDTIAYQTVHSYYTLTLNRADIPPHGSTGTIDPEGYNTYSVEMYPDSLRFLINDIHTFTYPRIETEYEGQFPFDSPFYLLIDMQLGGGWVGEVDPDELPAEMHVDRVRFYRHSPTHTTSK